MATDTWSDISQFSDDASFRALGKKISDSLDLIGLPKSADTGQIDWDVVSEPVVANGVAGYEIRYFDDSAQGDLPVYIKIEYGRGASGGFYTFRPWITVASGTDGAGSMTGTVYLARQQVPYQENVGASGLYPWFFCHKPGYLAIAAARNRPAGQWFLSICRTCDEAGEINHDGLYIIDANPVLRRRSWIGGGLRNDGQAVCFFPSSINSTAVGSDRQVMRHYALQPEIRVVPFYVSYIDAEIGNNSTFEAITSGVAPRTFLALGAITGNQGYPERASLNSHESHKLAMQYD